MDLNDLKVGEKYVCVYDDGTEDNFIYLGYRVQPFNETHTVLLEDGSESFLLEGDKVIIKEEI